jgi:hypothetical protein
LAKLEMDNYQLLEDGKFLINDFQSIRPFASFLPGIAGPMGVPLWVFYVNRGQAIASFGVEDKDKPILEFQPANRAYQLTSSMGFRTFIRLEHGKRFVLYEPFATRQHAPRKMIIGANELHLEEVNSRIGLQTSVVYFLLPGENLAGLVRMVTVTNLSDKPVKFEMLDGLPAVIPFGINNQMLKEIGRTVEAWMEVYNLDQKVPFYRLRASVEDTTEVSSFEAGHYMLAFREGPEQTKLLPAIVDPIRVFGQNTAFSIPEAFFENGLAEMLAQKQITCSRTPCGFSAIQSELGPGEHVRVNSIFGHASRLENIQSRIVSLTTSGYLDKKRIEANSLVQNLTEGISCNTSSPTFDAYCRQTFLDNTLRGGWPVVFGKGLMAHSYHIYSRKHGDLERDYNAFSLAPEFYSQGNGSYRDVNQNRREDVWFNPAVEYSNIRVFMSLIQADGYNPLIIQGSSFSVPPGKLEELMALVDDQSRLRALLSRPFSPGSLLKGIAEESIHLNLEPQAFLERVLEVSEQQIQAANTEGYWIDHWIYNLDLIESFLSVFPDQKGGLLYSNHNLPFYNSPVIVQPRSRKYVLVNGQARQMGSLIEDQEKAAMLAAQPESPHWLRTANGTGTVYRTSLFAKLLILTLIKFASIDPCGLGIEMEAGRPGWYDALNGLPGLFGSSMPETYSLKRLVLFLINAVQEDESRKVRLPIEVMQLLRRVVKQLKLYRTANPNGRDYQYWDNVSLAREAYRRRTRLGLDGALEDLSFSELGPILDLFKSKIEAGIALAIELNKGLPPTYFINRVEEFDLIKDKHGQTQTDPEGRPYIHVTKFKPQPLPLFLEGMVRAMSVMDNVSAKQLYEQVKASSLFDRKLRMYKINASLEGMPKDVGRARAFTPGWLENESIWLHMEYKYLLEVLRAGLFEDFFEDCKTTLIPFLDPNVYGRSNLENSSFLVSSAHPDELLHGVGFVARLSGATAEFLSIWRTLMAGGNPFVVKDGQLMLMFKPILPGWLFKIDGTVSYNFLGHTKVIYHNPERLDTFGGKACIRSIKLHSSNDEEDIEFPGEVIPSPYAQKVRAGKVKQIDVQFC